MKLRPEVVDASGAIDEVQMSLFRAVYSSPEDRPQYADAEYFGEITHPTSQLVDLLAKIAVRLGGEDEYTRAPALTRLNQGMGGGKSHACIGAWHLATNPEELALTDVGREVFAHASQILGRPVPAGLRDPHVVVLSLDNMTPGASVQEFDGPGDNLFERFLWRLVGKDYPRYERYRPLFNDKSKIAEAIGSVGRPVLIIADETMDYVGNGLDGTTKPDLVAQDMAFLRALLDVVNDVPNVAMLVVMISSEHDTMALSSSGAERREELHSLLERNGRPATVNENADFAAILRRRLFEDAPPSEILVATLEAHRVVLEDSAWKREVFGALSAPWVGAFDKEIERTYPFHPQLIHLAEHEWANLTGFQKVRSTIRVFAATVYALAMRASRGEWVPLLIGPGDLPLSDDTVRESVLGSGLIVDSKTEANYRSLAQNDIVSLTDDSGSARRLDLEREPALWSEINPRAAERAATTIFLASIVGARGQGRRGASEDEVRAATSVPDLTFGLADADGVLRDFADPDVGLAALEVIAGRGGQPQRLYLSTRQTITMLVRAIRNTVTDEDRDATLSAFVEKLTVTGPFRRWLFIESRAGSLPLEALSAASFDDARVNRLVVLDPGAFTLRDGADGETLEAIDAALGLGDKRLPVEWSSSAVFVIANNQRRAHARKLVVEYLAWERALDAPEVSVDESLRDQAVVKRNEVRKQLEAAIKRAYQHVIFLAQPDPEGERFRDEVTFDSESLTALDGTHVWKALAEKQKTFESGQFTVKALLHNLRESDYGRPLSEIRDSFWQAPRLALLPGGESDLRQAIFDAVRDAKLRIVDGAGKEVVVTGVGEINLASTGLRLARPTPDGDGDKPPSEESGEGNGGRNGDEEKTSAAEKTVAFTLMKPLNDPGTSEKVAQVFVRLYEIIDGGRASHVQGTVQIVVSAEEAESLAARASELGINVTTRDQ
jgi:Protein of unknown function (DUF499)